MVGDWANAVDKGQRFLHSETEAAQDRRPKPLAG